MKLAHILAVVACAGGTASLALAIDEPAVASKATQAIHIRSVTNLVTGQVVTPGDSGKPQPRGSFVGFDNLSLPASSAQINVAYVQPGSYDGSNALTTASIFGLGDGAAGSLLRAATNANFPNPTDILYDAYTGDSTVWPGGEGANAAILEYSTVVVLQNNDAVTRPDTIRVLFLSADGLTFIGGFQIGLDTPAGFAGYGRIDVDLSALNPPAEIPQDGVVMVDYLPPAGSETAIGVGLAFAGGDLANLNYPDPNDLVTVGVIYPTFWIFTDGTSGDVDHPDGPDENFDMEAGLSYVDILNTGLLVNWGFTSAHPGGAIGTRTLTHDFPMRLTVGTPPPAVGACVIASESNCFVSTADDCATFGGEFHPEILDCGAPGACCLPSGCTEVAFQIICSTSGGTFGGDFPTSGVV